MNADSTALTGVTTDKPIRLSRVLVAIAVLIVVSTGLKFYAATPTWMHYDEIFYLNISQNYIERGGLTPYMWRLNTESNVIAGSGTGYGIMLLVWWMKFAGNTLLNGRVLMIGIGLITAGVMYFVGRAWWRSEVGGITALIFALVSTSPFYNLVVRMDAFGALAYSLILLCHIVAVRRQSRWLHGLTGIAVIAGAEFHVLSVFYAVIIGIWHVTEYIGLVLKQRRLVLDASLFYYAGAGLIATVIYAMIHILPDPAAYFLIPSEFFEPTLYAETLRYARLLVLRPVEFALLFVMIITAVLRRRHEDRHILILLGAWLVVMTFVPPAAHYTTHMWPLLAIGLGGFFAHGINPRVRVHPVLLRLGIALAIGTLLFNVILYATQQQPSELRAQLVDHPALAYIRETVPEDAVVMAHAPHFYFLQDFVNFMSYRDMDERLISQRGETMLDYWRRELPQIFVGGYRSDDPELDQYMNEQDFAEVFPDVWIAASLRQQLELDITANEDV